MGNVLARRAGAVALAGVLAVGMAGCSAGGASSTTAAESSTQASVEQVPSSASIDESAYDLEYSKRDSDASYDDGAAAHITLSGATAESSDAGVAVDGSTVTISAEGVYVLSGALDDGQVVVNAPEDAKVQLVLNGASIANAGGPAINVQQADKCFVTLAAGTENKLADGTGYADAETEANAALYATCDLTLQGSGELSVSGNSNDAIKTKDDLVITGGSYAVKAAGDALVGHDSVKVSGGTFAIDAGNDAVKSSKDDDESKGFVSIDGGTFKINATDKGVKAQTYLRVSDGAKLDITAGDDAIHSENSARIAGGEITISSGDDAVHAEYTLVVDDGTVDITKCVEGYEAQVITVNGSTTNIVSSDDGINASTGGTSSTNGQGGQDGQGGQGGGFNGQAPEGFTMPDGEAPSGGFPDMPEGFTPGQDMPDLPEGFSRGGGQGGGFGGGMMDSDENCVLTINGGTITVEAGGDGVDSNGHIYMNGGEVYVSGPTNGGNGSLDYGTDAEVTGGTFIAAGSSGMAETFTGGTQGFALVNASGSAGDTIQVKDSSGKVLVELKPTKSFQCVVVSAPGMTDGGTYKLSVNGNETEFTATTTGSSNGFGGMPGGQRPGGDRGIGGAQGNGGDRGNGGAQDNGVPQGKGASSSASTAV